MSKTSIIIKENKESEFDGYLTTEISSNLNFDYLNLIIRKLIKEEQEKKHTRKIKIDGKYQDDGTIIFTRIIDIPINCQGYDVIEYLKKVF